MNETFLLMKIRVDFWLDGKQYAQRQDIYIPVIGDEVRFHNVVYKIVHRIWIYDEKYPRVAVTMEKIV